MRKSKGTAHNKQLNLTRSTREEPFVALAGEVEGVRTLDACRLGQSRSPRTKRSEAAA